MKKYYTFLAVVLGFVSFVSAQGNSKHAGEKVNICGKISGAKSPEASAAKTTVITVNQTNSVPVNVVIKQEDRKNFSYKPEEYLYSKNVCVTGTTSENNGKTEYIVRRPEEIKVEESNNNVEMRPFDFDVLNKFQQHD